jgi:hypothetical protein
MWPKSRIVIVDGAMLGGWPIDNGEGIVKDKGIRSVCVTPRGSQRRFEDQDSELLR